MRVIQINEFGPPENMHMVERPDPRPGPGQVVVRVGASGVLSLATALRRGAGPAQFEQSLPMVLGRGAAGRVCTSTTAGQAATSPM